jgi:hypothetical protein
MKCFCLVCVGLTLADIAHCASLSRFAMLLPI